VAAEMISGGGSGRDAASGGGLGFLIWSSYVGGSDDGANAIKRRVPSCSRVEGRRAFGARGGLTRRIGASAPYPAR
jgi:hypothetical protein